jgi:hypothetical protein
VSSIEERLRDAYRGAADTVRPDGIRQLNEPSVLISFSGHQESGRTRRRLIIPLAAAAAVALIGALTAVIVPNALSGSRSGKSGPRPPAAAGISTRDHFIVTTAGTALIVRNADSGARVATIGQPARGLVFTGIATGDGRHWVAELWRPHRCSSWLYQFRLSSSGRPSALTPYAIPVVHELLGPIAVSQDNSTFGYAGVGCSSAAGRTPADIALVTVATKAARQWTIPKQADIFSMSLTADGSMLAFQVSPTKLFPSNAYVLSASAAPGQALARSRVVARGSQFNSGGAISSDAITPDGSQLYFTTYATGAANHNRWQLRVASLSAGTTRLLGRYSGLPETLIANPSVTRGLVVIQGLPSPKPTPSPTSAGSTPKPSPTPAGATPLPSEGGNGGISSPSLRVVLINLATGRVRDVGSQGWEAVDQLIAW